MASAAPRICWPPEARSCSGPRIDSPDAPRCRREPSIDAGREVVLIAAPEGLVLLGEDDTTTAPWDRVTGIRRSGEVAIVTVRADDDADEREFAFERVASERSLLAWKNASAGSFVTAAERVRDA